MLLISVALSLLAIPFVRAEVFPNFPAGDVLRSGSNCHIGWAGDTSSTTTWKDMSIQLMTGPNLNMVHITTVALHLDGTVTGGFDWTCPEVTDNSAIYFYQFTSPKSVNTQWTTRFTIASSTGATNPPPHATHPDGSPIPWGTGALKDPSKAVPPPVYGTPTTPGTPGPTPTNIAPGVASGCTSFFTETNLLCFEIAAQFGITVAQFQAWNGAGVCNVLQTGLAYCVANPGAATPTPTNVAPGVVSGCTTFFTETNLLCFEIAAQFGITVEQFQSWNGAGVCSILQTGLAYCVAGPATSAVPVPSNAVPGAAPGCKQWFDETNLLCFEIAAQFGITVAQFEAWNGAGVCNVLQTGTAYCVSGA